MFTCSVSGVESVCVGTRVDPGLLPNEASQKVKVNLELALLLRHLEKNTDGGSFSVSGPVGPHGGLLFEKHDSPTWGSNPCP